MLKHVGVRVKRGIAEANAQGLDPFLMCVQDAKLLEALKEGKLRGFEHSIRDVVAQTLELGKATPVDRVVLAFASLLSAEHTPVALLLRCVNAYRKTSSAGKLQGQQEQKGFSCFPMLWHAMASAPKSCALLRINRLGEGVG